MNHIETYNKQDFPNNQYNLNALQNEIKSEGDLFLKYLHINTFGNEVYINFNNILSVIEKSNLNVIVNNHNMMFGIVPEPFILETPEKEFDNDISFNTPRQTPLTSINETFTNITMLGVNGPDLSNITSLTLTWDLVNKQLNSFNFNTNDGQPQWWFNLMPIITQSFDSISPDFSIQGSGIPNLDGNYWINIYQEGIVFVSKSGTFSIYASNLDTEINYVPSEYDENYLITNPITKEVYKSPYKYSCYGSEYKFVKSYAEQSTSSNQYQTALSLNTINLSKGNYKIVASHRYGITVTNNEFKSRILINGEQIGGEFIVRENRNVNRKYNQFIFIEMLENDVVIDLQYNAGSGTAYISDMIIEVFKIN